MLYVFSVDIGTMYSFEMELAMESVQTLMSAIASSTGITVDKQVLLITGGETLDPNDRVCNYSNAGTDTSPIYLFSKSSIESSTPPLPSLTFGSESGLKERVEVSFKLPPTYDTLVSRAQLASEFNQYAIEIAKNCERLVSEQSFQQLGWAAVMANLNNISTEFNERISTVELSYKEFLESRQRYLELLKGYDEILNILAKIPVLPSLLPKQQTDRPEFREGLSLLEWISAQDNKNSLQDMVIQCNTAIEQLDGSKLDGIRAEVAQVREALNNSSMKEIKGLGERLMLLQEFLQRVQELVQSQGEMAQGFIQNQTRAQNIGDASVLPDLCASHQKQLRMLMKNHSQLRDYLRRCARAKEELSINLHTRLRWIMYVEKKLCDCDSTLIMHHENIRRAKRRLDILDQVSEAPKLYLLASAEVVRRHKFSSQFLKWATKLHESVNQMHSEESARREEFHLKFGRHFLQTLFTGLEDRPSKFADKLPKAFDTHLPIITEHDVDQLQSIEPKFKDYLLDSPLNVSMREDETGTLSLMLKLQESQMATSEGSIKNLSTSKTAMSVDASTQAVWMAEPDDGLSKDLSEEIQRNLKDASQSSTEESVPAQSEGESPPKGYHRDSDTGSEPSSGLTDSDIMFRSAQEDYVTVVESDFDTKDGHFTQEPTGVPVSLEHNSSQTLTLTSSSSQSITASTQTDISLEEKLVCSETLTDSRDKTDSKDKETIDQLESKIKDLENELDKITSDYNKSIHDNGKLLTFRTSVKELLDTTVKSLREELSLSKEFISSCGVKLNQDMEAAWQDVHAYIADITTSISKISAEQTRDKYEQIIQQVNEKYEQEKNELLNLKSQLELEKNNIALELQRVRDERDSKVTQSADDFQKLQAVLEEYKMKYEEQQNVLTKQKEIRTKTEEGQQTRINSIIMSLTKEKKQIVTQLNEKMNEMKMENEKQKEKLQQCQCEMESLIKERELQALSLHEKEEQLNEAELKLQQAESKWNERELEFRSQLEKEKANALLLLEVERQMWEAGKNQPQDTEMEDSPRKQSDISPLNYEQRIAQLEQEYQIAREKLESQQEAISQALHQFEEGEINPILHQAKQALISKDEQIKTLKKQVQTAGTVGAVAQKPDKVSLKDFQCGDLVLLVYDPRYENYLIFSTGPTLYFLHPDSMAVLDLATSGTKRRDWVLAQLTDKEYCQAKKAHNRFHVPVGTKFYRIQAKPWER